MKKSKTGRTAYLNLSIWYNEDTGHIHMVIPDTGWFHTTVNDKPDSTRQHKNLFHKLARCLQEAGLPAPKHPTPLSARFPE